MRFAIVVLAVLSIVSADYQSCVLKHCASQTNACLADTECRNLSQKCYKQCGSDNACYDKCTQGCTNKAFLALKKCGLDNCVSAFEVGVKEQCTVQLAISCGKQFLQYFQAQQEQCEADYAACFQAFYSQTPECQCDFGF